jgi:hypothetical protein
MDYDNADDVWLIDPGNREPEVNVQALEDIANEVWGHVPSYVDDEEEEEIDMVQAPIIDFNDAGHLLSDLKEEWLAWLNE